MEEEPATESASGTILRLLLESMRSGSEDESDGDDDEIARIDHDSPRLEELRVKLSGMRVRGSESPEGGGATFQILRSNEKS